MKQSLVALILILALPPRTVAQSTSTQMGARAMAVGNASATLADAWTLFNNVGGLASTTHLTVAAAQEIQPALESASRVALAVAVPVRSGTAGLGVFRFGDALYNEQTLSAAYGNKRGIASLGIRASYVAYSASGFRLRQAFAVSAGGIATLTPQLSVGAYITNLNQPTLEHSTGERLPLQMTAGMSFRATQHFLLVTELQKDLGYDPVFRSGIEYEFHPQLIFRTGFNMHPGGGFLGLGYVRKKIRIDYAVAFRAAFGATHQISVICSALKTKTR